MKDADRFSRHRQEIRRLQEKRQRLEGRLLQRRVVIRASLIERHLGTRSKHRTAVSFYLSRASAGRTLLSYVSREDLPEARKRTTAWREFRRTLVEWGRISEELERLFRQLGRMQEERRHARRKPKETRPSSE